MNEQALKERLKSISQAERRTFQETWKLLCLERLLVRLAKSSYHDKFIFKGGLLLSHYIFIGRETKDIDLLMRQIKSEQSNIKEAFIKICDTETSDGFTLSFDGIDELEHAHMNYPGYRIFVNVRFGKMKDRIQIDIGIGDPVEPKHESLDLYQYRGKPLFEGAVSLQVYPVESIFAEKLESIVSRGATNSRMKDFHDTLLLCRENNLMDTIKLKTDINAVFAHRKTIKTIPVTFNDEEYSRLESLWSGHLRGLGEIAKSLNLPNQIADLVEELNSWLFSNFHNSHIESQA
jgi:predicted nucleotidyltransferase component of viral defense system